ncbi:GNAT family N-acetyltransferase [uncultured Jatrophihabitans sp.]|uniref:GNAT family N-acetyltransferase n=1 Tax=uncultured Jatrophihabitans sp. TaxID=1610747 RepID=UPI0035CC0F4D
MTDVEIRDANDADAGEILTLQRAAWVPEAQRHGWFFIPPLVQTLDELRADVAEQTVLVAVAGHRIVATVRGALVGTDWYVGRLGVVPDRQRDGLGRLMLAAIEARAPQSATRFTLTTGPKSVENIAFYERHGYHRVAGGDELVHLAKDARPTV